MTDYVLRPCWKCDGKGWYYWDIIDRLWGDKSVCKSCHGSGVKKYYCVD